MLIVSDEIDKKIDGDAKLGGVRLDLYEGSTINANSIMYLHCRFLSRVFQFYGSRFNTGSLYAQCFIVLTDF